MMVQMHSKGGIILLFWIASVLAASDLVALYDFNEGSGSVVNDRSGNGHDGTMHNAAWVAGVEGTSLYFDGTASYGYVTAPNADSLNFNSSLAFSISVWVKGTPQQVQDAGIVNKGVAQYEEYCVDASLNGYRFYVRNSSDAYTMVQSGVFPNNSWDHVVGVFDYSKSLMKIYVNGISRASAYPPSTLYPTAEPLAIGNRKNIGSSSYDMPFHGAIDNVRIYNRALTESEVRLLYQNPIGSPVYPMLIPVPSPTTNRRPLFAWHSIPQASAYMIQIDTTPLLSSPIIRATTSDTVFIVLADLPINTIYWQVIAAINDSLKYYSELGSFVIQDPRIPILIPYQPKVTQERKPVLKWHPVSGASTYSLQVAYNGSFSSPFLVLPLSDTFYVPTGDFPSGTVYWRVKSDLIDKWSIPDTFLIQVDSIPFLIRFNGATIPTARPLFQWHPVALADGYKIEFGVNRTFTGWFTLPLTDTFYVPLADLNPDTWYWHVSCSRNYQLFSPIDSFVVPQSTQILHDGEKSVSAGGIKISTVGKVISITGVNTAANPSVNVYSISGRLVYSSDRSQMNVRGVMQIGAGFSSGLYIVEVRNGKSHLTQTVLLR
jgi:hypothetical protein